MTDIFEQQAQREDSDNRRTVQQGGGVASRLPTPAGTVTPRRPTPAGELSTFTEGGGLASQLGRGLARTVKDTYQRGRHIVGAVTGDEDMQASAAARMEMNALQLGGKMENFTDIESVGDAANWVAYTLGSLAPDMLGAVATGGGAVVLSGGRAAAAMAARKSFEKQWRDHIAENAGRVLSAKERREMLQIAAEAGSGVITRRAALGSAGYTVPLETGSIVSQMYDEHGEVSLGTALVGGMVAGSLDAWTPVRILRKAGGERAIREVGREVLKGSGVLRAFKHIGSSMAVEGFTEAVQEIVSNASVEWARRNLDPDDARDFMGEVFNAETFREYINAAAAGALGGAVFGGGAAAMESRGVQRREEREQPTVNEADRRNRAEGKRGGTVVESTRGTAVAAPDGEIAIPGTPEFEQGRRVQQARDAEAQAASAAVEAKQPDKPTLVVGPDGVAIPESDVAARDAAVKRVAEERAKVTPTGFSVVEGVTLGKSAEKVAKNKNVEYVLVDDKGEVITKDNKGKKVRADFKDKEAAAKKAAALGANILHAPTGLVFGRGQPTPQPEATPAPAPEASPAPAAPDAATGKADTGSPQPTTPAVVAPEPASGVPALKESGKQPWEQTWAEFRDEGGDFGTYQAVIEQAAKDGIPVNPEQLKYLDKEVLQSLGAKPNKSKRNMAEQVAAKLSKPKNPKAGKKQEPKPKAEATPEQPDAKKPETPAKQPKPKPTPKAEAKPKAEAAQSSAKDEMPPRLRKEYERMEREGEIPKGYSPVEAAKRVFVQSRDTVMSREVDSKTRQQAAGLAAEAAAYIKAQAAKAKGAAKAEAEPTPAQERPQATKPAPKKKAQTEKPKPKPAMTGLFNYDKHEMKIVEGDTLAIVMPTKVSAAAARIAKNIISKSKNHSESVQDERGNVAREMSLDVFKRRHAQEADALSERELGLAVQFALDNGVRPEMFDSLTGLYLMNDADAERMGLRMGYAPLLESIVIRVDLFSKDVALLDPERRNNVRKIAAVALLHELGHHADHLPVRRLHSPVYESAVEPAMSIKRDPADPTDMTMGDLMTEAVDALYEALLEGPNPDPDNKLSPALALRYPLNWIRGWLESNKDNNRPLPTNLSKLIRAELYAQMFRLYHTQPEWVKRHMPQWYNYLGQSVPRQAAAASVKAQAGRSNKQKGEKRNDKLSQIRADGTGEAARTGSGPVRTQVRSPGIAGVAEADGELSAGNGRVRSGEVAGDGRGEPGLVNAFPSEAGTRDGHAVRERVFAALRGQLDGKPDEESRLFRTGSPRGTRPQLIPTELASEFVRELGGTPFTMNEVTANPASFYRAIAEAKKHNKHGAAVTLYEPNEYASMRLFMSEDGTAGFALKGDDIVSVFKREGSQHKRASLTMVLAAVEMGGRRLDAFDTELPKLYGAVGFKAVARIPWNDQYKPEGWKYEDFIKYNKGRPDVVFMSLDPVVSREYMPGDGAMVADYDAGNAAQAEDLSNPTIISLMPDKEGFGYEDYVAQATELDPDYDPEMEAYYNQQSGFDPLLDQIANAGIEYEAQTRGRWWEDLAGTLPDNINAAFHKWFGASVLRHEDGSPMVLYHGTWLQFPRDIPKHARMYLTDRSIIAAGYAERAVEDATNSKKKAHVYSVYARIQNPLEIRDIAQAEALLLAFVKSQPQHLLPPYLRVDSFALTQPFVAVDAILDAGEIGISWLESLGFDGIIMPDVDFNNIQHKTFIPLRANQIKSVFNRGTWSNRAMSMNLMPTTDSIPDGTVVQTSDGDAIHVRAEGIPNESWTDKVIRIFQDKLVHLKRKQQEIGKAMGIPDLPDQLNVHDAESRMHGKADNDVQQMYEEMVNPVIEMLDREDIAVEDLNDFLYASHAKERNAVIRERDPTNDKGSGITDQQADAIMQRLERHPKFSQIQQAADLVYGWQADLRQRMVEAGLLDDETLGAWQDTYDNYVPLKDIAEDEQGGGGTGLSVGGKESRVALGRHSQPTAPIMAQVLKDSVEKIVRIRRNEVAQVFVRLVEAAPDAATWTIHDYDNPPTKRFYNSRTRKVETRKVNLEDPSQAADYFRAKVGGKTVFVDIKNPMLKRAMLNMGEQEMTQSAVLLTKTMGVVTRLVARLNTTWNPEFMMSNFSRDLQQAMINVRAEADLADSRTAGNKADIVQMAKDAMTTSMAAMWRMHRKLPPKNEWDRYAREFVEDGGKTGWVMQHTVEELQQTLEFGLKKRHITNPSSFVLGHASGLVKLVDDANSTVENATRLAVYAHARKVGATREKAATLAKNVTVNFNRRGEAGVVANSLFVFYNATVQSIATLARALGNNPFKNGLSPVQKGLLGIMGLSFMSAAMAAAAGEDEDGVPYYDKIPDYIKERNLIIMGEGGEYYKIPLPYGYNIFHVAGIMMSDLMRGSRSVGSAAGFFLGAVVDSFSPLPKAESSNPVIAASKMFVPTALTPAVELWANENYFGAPIYPEQIGVGTPKPPSSLSFRNTSAISKGISSFLNHITGGTEQQTGGLSIPPDSLEYLVGYFTGGAGRFVGRMAGLFEATISDEKELRRNDIPFLRIVAAEKDRFVDMRNYMDHKLESDQALQRWEALRGPERVEFRRENRHLLDIQPTFKESERRLKLLRERRRTIEQSNMTTAEKMRRISAIEEEMTALFMRTNRLYNQLAERKGG